MRKPWLLRADVASDAESADGEVGDVEVEEGEAEAGGSVKEKEGLPDGPEASAALGVRGGDSDDDEDGVPDGVARNPSRSC